MKPEHLAVALSLTALAIVVPAAYSAYIGQGYFGLLAALPILPFVVLVLWKLVPWAFREEDAQLSRLLMLFECSDAAEALQCVGVKTMTDLEYVTPDTLSALKTSVINKAKLEDALRHMGARGWTKQVFEAKDSSTNAKCKICDKHASDHHGIGKYCSKRCADALARLLKVQIPQLFAACREGDDRAVLNLVTAGVDINVEDPQGRSPLHCACHWGMGTVAASLISSGANVKAKSKNGYSPMHYACEGGNTECVRVLLNAGVSAKEVFGESRTALHLACGKRATGICELLLENGADVNARDNDGSTPLHECGLGSAEAKVLIKHGANVNARDKKNRTPLHKFAFVGTRSVIILLLEAKAQVDAKDAEGCTALHWASKEGKNEVVKFLLQEGKANANVQNLDGETPLHFAQNVKAGEALLEGGADHEIKDFDGATPLDAAIEYKNVEMERLLRPLDASSKKAQ